MRLVLWLGLVLAVVWLWRGWRSPTDTLRKPKAHSAPEPMVACAVCGLHLPQQQSLAGPSGQRYCCAEHRQQGRAAG